MLPVAGLLLALALGGRWARGLALTLLWLGLAVALAIAATVLHGAANRCPTPWGAGPRPWAWP